MTVICITRSPQRQYLEDLLFKLTDLEILNGIKSALTERKCLVRHWLIERHFNDHLESDECRFFKYKEEQLSSNGLITNSVFIIYHLNMRWFKEWCLEERPHLLNKILNLEILL